MSFCNLFVGQPSYNSSEIVTITV